MSETTTTGPENPLHDFTSAEKEQLVTAEAQSAAAFEAFQDAREAYLTAKLSDTSSEEEIGRLKEKRDAAEEVARSKDNVLKGLQDFCD